MSTQKEIKAKLKTQYRHPDSASRDIHALIQNFKNLKIQNAKQFIHPNGSTENLASLTGTIPVKVRGATYNIPVAIWLRRDHPYQNPIVFVTPTNEMGIQASQFVDRNGMVYLPYLTEWKPNHSDLTALTQVMCATFGESCPVFSRRAAPPQQQPQQQWAPQPRPPPTSYHPPPAPYSSLGQQYPPRPPQPVNPYPQGPGQYRPPYPSGGPAHMPVPYGYQPPGATGAQPPHGYPMGQPGAGQYPGMYSPPTSQPNPPGIPTVATAVGLGAASAAITAEEEARKMEETERIKRQSLEMAVEDRIRRHVKQAIDTAQDEMESLLKTQEGLKKGSLRINQMLQDLENKQREVDQSIDMLKTKNTELQSVLDFLKSQPDRVEVDDAVDATTPLYRQILLLYAEENAVDDTIYYLGEALRKGVIELEVFLKYVRELSRQQFMARATIMKARDVAGLPKHGVPT